MKGVNSMKFSQLQKEVYDLTFVQGMSPEKVSIILGTSLTLVKRAMVLSYRKLKREQQSSTITCCICGKKIRKINSHNPAGAVWKDKDGNICTPIFDHDARCCEDCNRVFVIPGRLYQLSLQRKKGGE